MPRFQGSLLAAIQAEMELMNVAVVVVDEQEMSTPTPHEYPETRAQMQLLAFANRENLLVCLIEFVPPGAVSPGPTRIKLKGLCSDATQIVTKHTLNAFQGTPLRQQL